MIDYPLVFQIRREIFEAGLPKRLSDDWTGMGTWDHALHMLSIGLQECGVRCSTVCVPPPDGVIIAHTWALKSQINFSDDAYVLCYQGDWTRFALAQAHIVINEFQVSGPNLTLMDHLCGVGKMWHLDFIPEPSLIPRSYIRDSLFRNIAYLGTPYNLLPDLRTTEWTTSLRDLGLNFTIIDDPSLHADYSDVDCVVAVRPPDRNPDQKPPNKLWNAWRAGVPAILGSEAGFRECRKSDLDYLEANSAIEVLDCLKLLSKDVDLRKRIINNGICRAAESNVSTILASWIDWLQGPLREDFFCWKNQKRWKRTLFNLPRKLRYQAQILKSTLLSGG